MLGESLEDLEEFGIDEGQFSNLELSSSSLEVLSDNKRWRMLGDVHEFAL